MGGPGEGAAVWLLETREHARQRGANPIAVIAGLAMGMELESGTGPEAGSAGLEGVIREALGQAGVALAELDAYCAQGTVERVRRALGRIDPGADLRRVDAGGVTGWLDGSQGMVDVMASLLLAEAGGEPRRQVLAVVSTARGWNGAWVVKRVDN